MSPNNRRSSDRSFRLQVVGLAVLLLLAGAVLGCVEPPGGGDGGPMVVDPGTHPDPTDGVVDTDQPDLPTTPTVTPAEPEALCQVTVECDGGILDEPKSPCAMQVVGADGTIAYDGSAGFELRGRSSADFPKKHYGLELRTHSELPVWPGGTWSYLDDGSDLGIDWREPGYDDSAWASGSAPMGHGGDYLDTETADPDGRSLTTYFRREFDPADSASITEVELGLQSRDGAAVYLNGSEVLRHNLSPDAAYDAGALAELSGDTPWVTATLPLELVVDGPNVLAIEVHLASEASPELRFNAWVEARGDDVPTELLGMGREEDWILNGQYVDRALFRNRLAFDLFQGMGEADRYATKTRFCELELDGEYLGVYTLGEKLERDGDRIDIDAGAFPGETFIIKLDDEDGFHDNAVGNGTWQLVHPDPGIGGEAVVGDWLTAWEEAILGPDPADPVTGIFGLVDLDSAVDWVIVNELLKNHDAYLLSVYLWKDVGGKAHFAPWDLDLSMGGYPYTDCGAEGWVSRDFWPGDGEAHDIDFVEQMAQVPAFRDRLVERWTELRAGDLAEDALLARIDAYDATLAPALDANAARWPVEEITFSFSDVENWLCPVASYDEEHANTVAFLSERLAWIDANITEF